MKYYIFLDSSNISLTVGLANSNEVLESTSYEAWQCQSEYMIPELNKLLIKHKINNSEIEKVVVAIGPGSYTGIRISLTIAKTMAVCLNCEIYPISSLQVLKKGNLTSICLINARSERSYFGVYEGHKVLISDKILSNEEVIKYINEHPNYVVCGDLKYLNMEGYKSNICDEMFNTLPYLKKVENALALAPIYMKD